jgi:hypothetical protein
MASQVTHVNDHTPDGRPYLRQVVSPDELRRILRRDRESLERPKDFGPDDEWNLPNDP